MTTLVIPNAAQVGIEMVASGQKVMNVIGIVNVDAVSINTILAAVKTAWEQPNGPMEKHSTTTKMVGYHGVDLNTALGQVGFLSSTMNGTTGGDISTMASCAIIKVSSNTRSRSGNGRLYHGPLIESQVDSDGRSIASAYLDGLTNAYELFRNSLVTANHHWCILSRKNSTYTPVETSACQSIIGTQRRRLR